MIEEPPAEDRRRRRNLLRRARRRVARQLSEIEARVRDRVHVRPCIDCGSTQLCEPDCGLAPWNQ